MTTDRPGCPSDNDALRQFGAGPFDQETAGMPPESASTGPTRPSEVRITRDQLLTPNEALRAAGMFNPFTATPADLLGQAERLGCLIDENTDSEAFAALPECDHCEGTGKNLAGSPWASTPAATTDTIWGDPQ